jgi:hypothetical protein
MSDPKVWPPRVGDVWLGNLDRPFPKSLVCTREGKLGALGAEAALDEYGPLRLVWRDGQLVTEVCVAKTDLRGYETDATPQPRHGEHGTCARCSAEIEYCARDDHWTHVQQPADAHPAVIGGPA